MTSFFLSVQFIFSPFLAILPRNTLGICRSSSHNMVTDSSLCLCSPKRNSTLSVWFSLEIYSALSILAISKSFCDYFLFTFSEICAFTEQANSIFRLIVLFRRFLLLKHLLYRLN